MSRAHVTVIGKDKSGVIARICQFLFDVGGNIEELDQHVTQGLFTMHLEVSWDPTGNTAAQMEAGLMAIGDELGMDIHFRSALDGAGPTRIGLLVTKEQHAPRAVLEACAAGTIDGEVVLVLGNHPDLEAMAAEFEVPFLHVSDVDKNAHEQKMLEALTEADVQLVVLARYMRILSPNFVWRFPHRIINIHPSLLPAFPGAVPYRQAIERGVRIAGVTAHLVTVDLDQGPIIAQQAFDIGMDVTVAEVVSKGQELEQATLVEAIGLWTQGLDVGWGRAKPRS